MFKPVNSLTSFSFMEQEVLAYWRENNVFQKSLENRQDCEQYVFFDGPPFATGLPHYGHLLAGTIKDVIPRYQTMCGKYVRRTFGWDCHGLPVENEIEKQLNLGSKTEIESYGIDRFNEACRGIVMRYTTEWEQIVERTGRWVDFRNGYRTMDLNYMESIWWVFKQLWDKGMIYEGAKILPYCPRCATPLSNFEANQGYQDKQDPAITIRFKSLENDHLFFLAWTTTPWTLPSNTGLAVGPEIDYVCVQDGEDQYIMAEARLSAYYKNNVPEIVQRFKGKDLVGKLYEPLFDYFPALREKGAWKVIPAEYVSVEDGTGIVHIAPGFGEDDAEAGRKNNLPMVCPIDAECRFTEEITDYVGMFVKDADKDIIKRLKEEKKLVHQGTIQHNYPHCWRCDTPLIYRAISTWFVDIDKVKAKMIKNNKQIRWMPDYLRDGRFGKWLENARDWAISRNRYWGCPLPIWRSEDGKDMLCVGSVAELEELVGHKVTDIHKHFVDAMTIEKDGKVYHRIPEVLDCWFESGSMPYAQHHYPFENKEFVESHFPADFIAEGLDQTRGWFYTLVVIGSALFDKPPYKNVVVNGLILAEDGKKMSKRLKNYPDPTFVMDQYGADALRLCMMSSPVVRAMDLRFSEAAVREVMRTIMLPIWNSYAFFVTYARVDNWEPRGNGDITTLPTNLLDRWVLSRLEDTVARVRKFMDAYDLMNATQQFSGMVEDLTNWYIRRSRRRFWKSEDDSDKQQAYQTLYYVLITIAKLAAPFIPFMSEAIYRNLRTEEMLESVHLCDYPMVHEAWCDETLNKSMATAQTAVKLGHFLRKQENLRARQPLASAIIVSAEDDVRNSLISLTEIIKEELNVKEIKLQSQEEDLVHLSVKPNLKVLGPRYGAVLKQLTPLLTALDSQSIAAMRSGETLHLTLSDGQVIDITEKDVLIQRTEKEGITVANEGAVTVAIETALSDELIAEGWAREIINRIQNLRKESGMEVSDRIVVYCKVPEMAEKAILSFKEYIQSEVLASDILFEEKKEMSAVDINDKDCYFYIEKVSA